MPSVPRTSVHTRLTITVLLAIIVSFTLSTGMANYMGYRDAKAVYQEMLRHPEIFPYPRPAPTFGLREFFLGPRRGVAEQLRVGPRLPMPNQPGMIGPPPPGTVGPPPQVPPPPRTPGAGLLVIRAAIALILALLAGTWLYSRFTRPLVKLEEGAKAFHSGDFKYRIPIEGDDEFTQVAAAMNVMADRVSEQISRLEDDATRRRQFLADVAHELRSPVTTLRTMAGAMQEGLADDPERRARAVESLVSTSDRMLHLVTDLLELAKLDLQELPLNVREVDVREIASAAVHAHAASASDAHVVLHPVEAGPPVMATVDPDRLTQVLDNLLNNAISYAGEGAQVHVIIEDKDPLRIEVSDDGRGIPAKHLPHVFEPFYRADTARTPGDSHSGLGLRIARGLARAQDGDLLLSSVEGKGTTATITLPRCP